MMADNSRNNHDADRPVYHTFYGTTSRFFDRQMGVRVEVTRNADGASFTHFQTQSQRDDYVRQLRRLKDLGKSMKDLYNNGNINLREYKWLLGVNFIPSSEQFVHAWGPHMVEWELHQIITNARHYVGLPIINWPAILLFLAWGPDTNFVTAPGRVDEYGRAIFDKGG